jgi:hypothetical protein
MLVDIGFVPLHFYQYGSDDSDQVGAQQDSTIRNETKKTTDTKKSVTQSLTATTLNMNQFVASTSIKMAKENTTGKKTQSPTTTASNVAQSLAARAIDFEVDNDDRKPAAVSFVATAGNKTHPPAATACTIPCISLGFKA